MRRTARTSAVLAASAALLAAGCGRSQQPPEPTPVAVRVEALLPLHPAWRDHLALAERAPAQTDGRSPAASKAPGSAAVELPRRLVYEVPAAAAAPGPIVGEDRIEDLRPNYERRNATYVSSALRQRLRELEAVRGPIAAALARSDAIEDALYRSQWNEQVAPLKAKALALQSQLDAWSSDRAVREQTQAKLDALEKEAAEAETRLKLALALRRTAAAQRILDARDREADAIRQDVLLLEAERNADVGRQIAAYKRDVVKGRQGIQPLTGTVVPKPVVATPPELREPPQPVSATRPPAAAEGRRTSAAEQDRQLLDTMRRDVRRRVERLAALKGWRPVYEGGSGLPDHTNDLRAMLLAEDWPHQ